MSVGEQTLPGQAKETAHAWLPLLGALELAGAFGVLVGIADKKRTYAAGKRVEMSAATTHRPHARATRTR
jgi:hypothetical protein